MKFPSVEVLIVLSWSLTAVDVLLTTGRFLIRWRRLKNSRLDDFFNGIALLLLIIFMITWQLYIPTEYRQQEYESGLRATPPTGYDSIVAQKIDSANLLIFRCLIYTVKASFLALYWQVFEIEKRFMVAWRTLAVYIGLSFAISFLSVFWHCGTPDTFINPPVYGRWKHRTIDIAIMAAVLHIVGDIMLMILPMMTLQSLQMRMREKIGLAVIFALVLVEVAFTIIRVVFSATLIYEKFRDRNVLWTTLDPIVAVMVCALPCYRSLFLIDRGRPIIRNPNVSFYSAKSPSRLDVAASNLAKPTPATIKVDQLEDVPAVELRIEPAQIPRLTEDRRSFSGC